MKKKWLITVLLALFLAASCGVTTGVFAMKVDGEGAQPNMDVGRSTSLGLINDGEFFSAGGYQYQNYQNAYTKEKEEDGTVYSYFGFNVTLGEDDTVTETLVDLTEKTVGKGLLYLPGDFSPNYAAPLGADLAGISTEFRRKYQQIIGEQKYNMGTTASGIITWQGMLMQNFQFADSLFDNGSGAKLYAFASIVYNPALKECFLFTDWMAKSFANNGNKHSIGAPVSDPFVVTSPVDGIEYEIQNFASGYLKKVHGAAASGTPVSYKNMTRDGYEYQLMFGNNGGNAGIFSHTYEGSLSAEDKQLVGASIYDKYIALQNELNRNIGVPRCNISEIQGVLLQFFQTPDDAISNSASAYEMHLAAYYAVSYEGSCIIAYNPTLQKSFLVRNDIMGRYVMEYATETGNAANSRFSFNIKNLGAPVGDEFVYDGNRYQNFERGYIKANGVERTPSSQHKANTAVTLDKWFETGVESDIAGLDLSGRISDSVNLYGGSFTPEQIQTAFSTALAKVTEENEGVWESVTATSVIKGVYQNGVTGNVQTFAYTMKAEEGDETAPETGIFALSFDPVTGTARFLSEAVYGAYAASPCLGGARTDFTVDTQYFENGFVRVADGVASTYIGTEYDAGDGSYMLANYIGEVGKIGSLPNRDPIKNAASYYKRYKYTYEDISAAMRKAYLACYEAGQNLGIPDQDGVNFYPTGRFGLIVQFFVGGDGNGEKDSFRQMLCYDPSLNKAYLVSGDIFTEYWKNIPLVVGLPSQEQIVTSDGMIVQNFYGSMGDFHYKMEKDGIVEYGDGAFVLSDYENALKKESVAAAYRAGESDTMQNCAVWGVAGSLIAAGIAVVTVCAVKRRKSL